MDILSSETLGNHNCKWLSSLHSISTKYECVHHNLFTPDFQPITCYTPLRAGIGTKACGLQVPGKIHRMPPPILSPEQWVPDSAQRPRFLRQPNPGKKLGLPAILLRLIRSRHALLNWLLKREYKWLSLGDRSWAPPKTHMRPPLPFPQHRKLQAKGLYASHAPILCISTPFPSGGGWSFITYLRRGRHSFSTNIWPKRLPN